MPIARQIADALEAAHEHGVIHRDLKPANIKLRQDGTVKVLDFGLAKAMEQGSGIGDRGSGIGDRGSVDATQSPTITSPAMTRMGVILGTAAYMAPEQAKGKTADARSDIWAFGVILLEMLTGKSVFSGETMVKILGGVLKTDPDWNALPSTTPPVIRSLIRRCLQKDRNRRLRDVADARFRPGVATAAAGAVSVGSGGAYGGRCHGGDRLVFPPRANRSAANGGSVDVGTPVALFTMRPGSQYAASPDGQRFLVNTALGEASTPPITIVLHWKPRP